jgi:hypothetical protein
MSRVPIPRYLMVSSPHGVKVCRKYMFEDGFVGTVCWKTTDIINKNIPIVSAELENVPDWATVENRTENVFCGEA